MRVSAAVTVALTTLYYAMRVGASSCGGGACDWYIPFSLLIPVAVLVMVAVTGAIAVPNARRAGAGAWALAIAIATAVGVAGPIAALAMFRDSPDTLVPVASVMLFIGPLCVLAYGSFGRPPRAWS